MRDESKNSEFMFNFFFLKTEEDTSEK